MKLPAPFDEDMATLEWTTTRHSEQVSLSSVDVYDDATPPELLDLPVAWIADARLTGGWQRSRRSEAPGIFLPPRVPDVALVSSVCSARRFPMGAFATLAGALLVGALTYPGDLSAQQPVSLPTPDSGSVEADMYGTGDRGVVLAHGGRFDKSSWEPQALALADAGFRVLAIDFRAAVRSRTGQESECLYDESCLAVDVLSAVRYLRRAGARSVSIVGASLGGAGAAQAAVEANEGEIDRVVLLAHMLIAAPEKMKGRKLFIVSRGDIGSGDKPRLPGIRDQYEKASGPKTFLILEGSAHAQAVFQTPEGDRLLREIVRFLSAP